MCICAIQTPGEGLCCGSSQVVPGLRPMSFYRSFRSSSVFQVVPRGPRSFQFVAGQPQSALGWYITPLLQSPKLAGATPSHL